MVPMATFMRESRSNVVVSAQNERCQPINVHISPGEITGEQFQSLQLVQKCGTFVNLVTQLSAPNS